ncbi:MAG: hypothetical protein HYW33_03725 [Candidatus Blackburnbacteria bacterium]|nr:hypothetical protein [Candidatus Blackburnbacteria bacterium]
MVASIERAWFSKVAEQLLPTKALAIPPRETQEVSYDHTQISLSSIAVLQQVRKTFEGIPELAQDIASKGLMSPLLVAELNTVEAERYLAVINDLWKTDYTTDDLIPTIRDGNATYRILIAGERRLRAIHHLRESGCLDCSEAGADCFHFAKKFPGNQAPVTLCVGISAREALNRQASENTHMSVPSHEEAVFYYEYYRVLQDTVDPNYPIERFARDVGRSPDMVRNALRYCALPARVRSLVEQGIVKYGIACVLTRYQAYEATRKSDEEIYYLALLNKDQRVEDFEGIVSADIARTKAGQLSLAQLLTSPEDLIVERQTRVRLTFGRRIVDGLHGFRRYLKNLNEAIMEGKIGQESSPYSERSPVRMVVEVARDLQATAAVMRRARMLSKDRFRAVCQQTQEVIDEGTLLLPHTSEKDENLLNVFGSNIYQASNKANGQASGSTLVEHQLA